jgi:hypothetical protein
VKQESLGCVGGGGREGGRGLVREEVASPWMLLVLRCSAVVLLQHQVRLGCSNLPVCDNSYLIRGDTNRVENIGQSLV